MRRLVPDSIPDDRAFLYATELTHDRARNEWTLRIDPDACLAGPAGETAVETIRNAPLERTEDETGETVRYTGRILFSAGVVLVLDGKQVLLRRGDHAPTAPGKWTSPAGRCDGPPWDTALKEFYEELVILIGDDRPLFVTVGDASEHFRDVYASSLAATGWAGPPADWRSLPATTIAAAGDHYETIRTEYGVETFESEMLAYFDDASNTLELRLALAVEMPPDLPLETFTFRDPEFGREIRRFGPAALEAKRAAGALVPTDAYLVATLDLLS